jgi:hypothetical protein
MGGLKSRKVAGLAQSAGLLFPSMTESVKNVVMNSIMQLKKTEISNKKKANQLICLF